MIPEIVDEKKEQTAEKEESQPKEVIDYQPLDQEEEKKEEKE